LTWAPQGSQPKTTKIDLVVSAGPRRVPNDLKGKSFADAQTELKALGLTAVESDDYSDDVQTGQVFGSDPPPGSAVPEGGQVTLKVSKGKAHIAVPSDLIGKTPEQAKAELESIGLKLGSVYGPAKGRHVFDTNPSPGTTLSRG